MKMASTLTREMDCSPSMSIWQHLWASNVRFPPSLSLSLCLQFVPCPILFTLPAIGEMDLIHLHKRQSFQMLPDPLKSFIPGQCQTKMHTVKLASWCCLWVYVMSIVRILRQLLLANNLFFHKSCGQPVWEVTVWTYKKPELSHDYSL